MAERGRKGQKNKRGRERRGKSNLIPPISCRNFPCDRVRRGSAEPIQAVGGVKTGVALQTRHRFIGEPHGPRDKRAATLSITAPGAQLEHLATMANFSLFTLYCVSRKCEED